MVFVLKVEYCSSRVFGKQVFLHQWKLARIQLQQQRGHAANMSSYIRNAMVRNRISSADWATQKVIPVPFQALPRFSSQMSF